MVHDNALLENMGSMMSEAEEKARLLYLADTPEDYLVGLQKYRVERDPSQKENQEVVEAGLYQVNQHVSNDIGKGAVEVVDVPRTKDELNEYFEQINNTHKHRDRLYDGPAEPMDLRVNKSREIYLNKEQDHKAVSMLKKVNMDR